MLVRFALRIYMLVRFYIADLCLEGQKLSSQLVAASISHFVFAATKFLCFSSNKKCLLCFFISRSKSLSPLFFVEVRWPVFLLLYIPNLWT